MIHSAKRSILFTTTNPVSPYTYKKSGLYNSIIRLYLFMSIRSIRDMGDNDIYYLNILTKPILDRPNRFYYGWILKDRVPFDLHS